MISTKKITEIARHVYKTLGPCHAESIYRDAMSIQLQEEGCIVKTEAPISIYFTTKNKKNTPDRMELKKFNPIMRKMTIHKELSISYLKTIGIVNNGFNGRGFQKNANHIATASIDGML